MKNIVKIFHADHGIQKELMQELVNQIRPSGFFLKTVELPAGVPDVMSAIYGPIAGDDPVEEGTVTYKKRTPDRPLSRMIDKPMRPTRLVTIIGNEVEDQVTVFTCYGGPAAEREPGDKSLKTMEEIEASRLFWSEHALSAEM